MSRHDDQSTQLRRISAVCGEIAGQRNAALDTVAVMKADLDAARARVAELEKELAALKPAEEAKEGEP